MLNFAEQTGSGAVIVVWSFLIVRSVLTYLKGALATIQYSFKTRFYVARRNQYKCLETSKYETVPPGLVAYSRVPLLRDTRI
jgi:hypothetical protein